MVIKVVLDYAALSLTSAQFIADEIRCKPGIVLGLAAGNTPSLTRRPFP